MFRVQKHKKAGCIGERIENPFGMVFNPGFALQARKSAISCLQQGRKMVKTEKRREKKCFIVGAGSFKQMSFKPESSDLIIAADGGYDFLKKEGIEPDLLMGDFDSIREIPKEKNMIFHPPEKDDTDMALAVRYAKEQGYQEFFLYGSLGGRLDHTLANLQLAVKMSQERLTVHLIGEKMIITAITREKICFHSQMKGILSVVSGVDHSYGVTETGLKYTLQNAELAGNRALGVRNEFIGQEASIEVKNGTLLIMWDEKEGLELNREEVSEIFDRA